MKVFKKIMAIMAVLIIIALYAAVIFCAIFIKQVGSKVFFASIVAAVSVPLLLYLVFWLYRLFSPKPSAEEESWETKTKKGFQEAAVFNRGGKPSALMKNDPQESQSEGLELWSEAMKSQSEGPGEDDEA